MFATIVGNKLFMMAMKFLWNKKNGSFFADWQNEHEPIFEVCST
jgi:hypothetical protein